MSGLLQDAADLYISIPFLWKLIGHCLIVSSWFQKNKDRFLVNYWTGLLGAFGGGILSSVILQAPDKAANALFEDNSVGVVWTICWWAMNYSPGGIVNTVHNLLPFRTATRVCMNMLRAGIIANRVDLCVKMFPGVVAAPLFVGTVAASGGKLLVDLIGTLSGELKGPSEVAEPGFPLRSGFFGSLLHWVLVHYCRVLKPMEGMALITSIFVLHGLVIDLTGRDIDYTAPVARMLHAATAVPMPGVPAKLKAHDAASTNSKKQK